MKKLTFKDLENVQGGNADVDAFIDGALCGACILSINTFWGALGTARCLHII